MIVSYKDPELRQYCSLLYSKDDAIYTYNEITAIRTIISDLKSAPNLNEVPLKIVKQLTSKSELKYQITEEQILISFKPISKFPNIHENRIRRIQILEISRIDLQLVDSHVISA